MSEWEKRERKKKIYGRHALIKANKILKYKSLKEKKYIALRIILQLFCHNYNVTVYEL